MKSALLRTGSIPVHKQNRDTTFTGIIPSSPRISFRPEHTNKSGFTKIRRSNSDTDLMSSRLSRVGSLSFPDLAAVVEEEYFGFGIGIGSGKGNDNDDHGGKGKGKGGNNNHDNNEKNSGSDIGDYYQDMLKSNPADPLLLRNYGKYLHEVEKNAEKAEECYGRAILASPGDGELLSLYGNLIWETSKDEDRAQIYYDRALHASPNDCMVMGSYAHFLWEAEDDEDDDEEIQHEFTGWSTLNS